MRPSTISVLLVLCACSGAGTTLNGSSQPDLRRSMVHARHGMGAASHPLAVQIGLDVLREGGSAVDAAIAANAALGVLEPHACGIGGDLFAIVWNAADRKLYGLNASGPAPARANLETIDRDERGRIPLFGAHSWSVPGCVDGWSMLHERFGRVSWQRLLEPAIRAAREGEPVPRVIANYWQTEAMMPESVRRGLEALGHRVVVGGSFGGYQAIARDPVTGVWSGATESRKDGVAMGY